MPNTSISFSAIKSALGNVNDGQFTLSEKGGELKLERVNRGSSDFTRKVVYKQQNLENDKANNLRTRQEIANAICNNEGLDVNNTTNNKVKALRAALGLGDVVAQGKPLSCRLVADLIGISSKNSAHCKKMSDDLTTLSARIKPDENQKVEVKVEEKPIVIADDSEKIAQLGEFQLDRPSGFAKKLVTFEELTNICKAGMEKMEQQMSTILNSTKPGYEGKKFGELFPNAKTVCLQKHANHIGLKEYTDGIRKFEADIKTLMTCENLSKELPQKIEQKQKEIAGRQEEFENTKNFYDDQLNKVKDSENITPGAKVALNQQAQDQIALMKHQLDVLRTELDDLTVKRKQLINLKDSTFHLQGHIVSFYESYMKECVADLKSSFLTADTDKAMAEKLRGQAVQQA